MTTCLQRARPPPLIFGTAGLSHSHLSQIPGPSHSCRGGEAVGTGRWLNGHHGGRSRLRSSPRNWPDAISTVPAWMISAFCAAARPPASGASWSLMASRSGSGIINTAMAGRPSSCAAETGRVSMRCRPHRLINRRHHARRARSSSAASWARSACNLGVTVSHGPRFIEPERRPGRRQSFHDALDPSGGCLKQIDPTRTLSLHGSAV
jgi:hypothetical protein